MQVSIGGVSLDNPRFSMCATVIFIVEGKGFERTVEYEHIKAPALHGRMTLEERAELSLTGYLLLELWPLLSRKREIKYSRKKGSHFMAGQTRHYLQSTALCVSVIAATKEANWDPFVRSQNLSEIHVEQHFGRLRSSSASGDLTARSYWGYAAKNARAQLMRIKGQSLHPSSPSSEPALSEETLLIYTHPILECLSYCCIIDSLYNIYIW